MTPEEARAHVEIDRLFESAGWQVCDFKAANLHAARGVTIREFRFNPGRGVADNLVYVDGKAIGVIEPKMHRVPITYVRYRAASNSFL